jgi:hypothetical protein
MAFPTVETTNTSFESSGVTTHNISLPSGVASGDLLIAILSLDGNNADSTWPTGDDLWTELLDVASSGNRLSIAYRDADGTEGATVDVTTDNGRKSSHITFRISGHTVQAPDISTGATGSGANPDPDSLTPAGGADDILWLAICGVDSEFTFSAWPTDYSSNQLEVNSSSGSFGSSAAVATRNINTTVQDPGTFTHDGSDQYVACTIAVYPGAGETTYTVTAAMESIFKETVSATAPTYAVTKETASATTAFQSILKETASAVADGFANLKETASQTAAGQAAIKMATGVTAAGASWLQDLVSATAAGYASLKEAVSNTAAGQAILKETANVTAALQSVFTETASATAALFSYLQRLCSPICRIYLVRP